LPKDTKVEFKGEMVPALDLEFEAEKEPWCIYRLEDGTVLRVRQVLAKITRLTDRYKPDGEPIYTLVGSVIVHADVPPQLKKCAEDAQPESTQ